MRALVCFLLCASILLTPVLTLTSCGIAGGPIDIGIVFPTKEEEWWLALEKGFLKEIEAKGYNAEIVYSQASSSVEKLNVDTLITRGMKVLIIAAYDMHAAVSTVEMAKSEGVTVISLDRLIMGTEAVDYYVTFDALSMGEMNAQYLVDCALRDGGKGHNLYLYCGALTDRNSHVYFRGYWNILQPYISDGTFIVRNSKAAEKYKDVPELNEDQFNEIMMPIDTLWNPEHSKTLSESNLTNAKPEEKANSYILSPNDATTRAIADTFLADAAVENYRITGMDGTAASVQYVIDGRQDMIAYGSPDYMSLSAINLANDILNGIDVKTGETTYNDAKEVESLILDAVLVTRDNVVEVFLDSGVYDKNEFTGYDKDICDAEKPESFYGFLANQQPSA